MKAGLKRLLAWRPWRRKSSRTALAGTPLREFIYLDEVSVYSLLASRRGAVPSEQTDSRTAQTREAVDVETSITIPPAKAGAKSQFETTSTRGTQVIRKSIIQSTFKELVDLEQQRMKFRDGFDHTPAPVLGSADALAKVDDRDHVVDCATLRRGDLLEVEVELAAEAVFMASQIVKTMYSFFDDMPEMFALDAHTREQGRIVDAVFDRLLVGLVPIRARLARYRRVTVEREELLVSTDLIAANPTLRELQPESVYLVGVTERELFWRDLRRVLFSASPFFVMGRLSKGGLSTSWNPIKMADVFDRQVPELAQQLDLLPTMFLDGMREGVASELSEPSQKVAPLAVVFATKLAEHVGLEWTEQDSAAAGLQGKAFDEDIVLKERRALSARIVGRLEEKMDGTLDPLVAARVRGEVFGASNGDSGLGDEQEDATLKGESRPQLIETEIVAIYW